MSNGNGNKWTLPVTIAGLAFTAWAGVVAWGTNLVTSEVRYIRTQVEAGILPRADERVRALERKIERLERELDEHGH